MGSPTIIHWFRQDLRLSDNPALAEAAKLGIVLPVYIHDDEDAGADALGGASRWWLHHSLHALNRQLEGKLQVFSGRPLEILPQLAARQGCCRIHWNRCHEPWRIPRDALLKQRLQAQGVEVRTYNASLLWEPWEVLKQDGTPYKVFTPYFNKGCLNAEPPRIPIPAPSPLPLAGAVQDSDAIGSLGLLPKIRWDRQLEPHWEIGEAGAQKRLEAFIRNGLANYKQGRDFPAQASVSRLSPHLHFGEISPNQAWHAAAAAEDGENTARFHNELGWREFSHYLLYHRPELPRKNLDRKFDRFPWRDDPAALRRWQRGQTGIPIVDAGMRELWQTGTMHNRVRMVVGSFLVKNLLLHWSHGAAWFWDCLVDADLANNSASWQWVAGCGADAAPYFRIFNPVTQGQKFDPDGDYTRRFVPELENLPAKYLFNPWEAPEAVLRQAGVALGKTYPHPVVELKASRERALAAYAKTKG